MVFSFSYIISLSLLGSSMVYVSSRDAVIQDRSFCSHTELLKLL